MKLVINNDKYELGKQVALITAKKLNEAIANKGNARILLSTGASQFTFFAEIVKQNVDWSKVEIAEGNSLSEIEIICNG